MDLVADLYAVVRQAIRDGLTLEEFQKDYYAVLDNYGWEPAGGRAWRPGDHRTNLRTSYAAGRYAQLQAVKATRPYWGYHHSDAVEHPRELHLAWDGLVIHADNPWWQTHYPPSGSGCEWCVTAYSLDELQAMGSRGPDEPPPGRMRNIVFHGEVVQGAGGHRSGLELRARSSRFREPGAADPGEDRAAAGRTGGTHEQATAGRAACRGGATQRSWTSWLDEVGRTGGAWQRSQRGAR